VAAIVNDIETAIRWNAMSGYSRRALQEPGALHPTGERSGWRLFAINWHPWEKLTTAAARSRFGEHVCQCRQGVLARDTVIDDGERLVSPDATEAQYRQDQASESGDKRVSSF
jgi:hypothetical protein